MKGNQLSGECDVILPVPSILTRPGGNRRDDSILEQFSRTTTSQSWYISKRISGSKRGGHEREIHMEVARKDSNLVDVDNDLATIVRRLDSTTY